MDSSIAVIPARSGSKRIPGKNIKSFAGRPMVVRAIDLAKKSSLFQHIIVSSDDQYILDIAQHYGAIALQRSSELSDDFTPTLPVIRTALSNLSTFEIPDPLYACCLYPCTPFLLPDNLRLAFNLLTSSSHPFVYPIIKHRHPIHRALTYDSSGCMSFILGNHETTRTQDLPVTYYDAGQFYFGRFDAWMTSSTLHSSGHGIELNNPFLVDIDNKEDWEFAENLFPTFEQVHK